MLNIPGLKDHIELDFRTVRLGTLRTFPVKLEPVVLGNKEIRSSQPVVLNEKGIKISIQLDQGDCRFSQ